MILALVLLLSLNSRADQNYYEAEGLLQEYSPYSSNLTHIKHLLETSTQLLAKTKLGELWLFGEPVSTENPSFDSSLFDSNGHFRRNFKKALEYFTEAFEQNEPNAAFYLALVVQQSLISEEFDHLLPQNINKYSVIKNLYRTSLEGKSPLAQIAFASAYVQCMNSFSSSFPGFLNNTLGFVQGALFDEPTCGRSCQDLGEHLVMAASESVSHILESGLEEIKYLRLDLEEKISNYETGERTMKLYTRHFEDMNDSGGYYFLGQKYLVGVPNLGIEKNFTQAVHFLELAAAKGNLAAIETLGVIYAKKNVKIAIEYLQRANNSAKALNTLGYMNYYGIGFPVNSKKAFENFKLAAEKGNLDGMNNAAIFFLTGEQTKPDTNKALLNLQAAAVADFAPAQFNLAILNLYGVGVKSACRPALLLFQHVIEKSHYSKLIEKALHFYKSGDLQGAYLSYAKASVLGFESAQLSAGYMWASKGTGFKCKGNKDQCAGAYYLQAALNYKNDWAYLKLGELLYERQEYQEAFKYYSLGKSQAEAVFAIGYMYEHGLGVEPDYQKARQLYQSIVNTALQGTIEYESLYPAKLALISLSIKTKALEMLGYFLKIKSWFL